MWIGAIIWAIKMRLLNNLMLMRFTYLQTALAWLELSTFVYLEAATFALQLADTFLTLICELCHGSLTEEHN